MSTRVLSTAEATQSITRMQSIISGGLSDQITQLDAEGKRLSDPNVWDGRLATEFRDTVWPQTNSALLKASTALEELRGKLAAINADILAAGGN